MNSQFHIGEIAAFSTACCWTITALAFESAGKSVGSLSVNLIRLIVGLLFLSFFCLLSRDHLLPMDASADSWFWLGISGLVGFTIGDLFLFQAFVVVGARISMLLMSLVPPITALIGYVILGESLTEVDLIGMTVTVGGVAFVVSKKSGVNGNPKHHAAVSLTGILLGIGGAVGQAMGLVLSKYGMAGYDPFAATQIRIIAGLAGFVVLITARGRWRRVWEAMKNRRAMSRIGLGAFFGPFLGVSLSLLSVKYTESGVAATIMSIVPVLIIPPSILIKKEKVPPRAVIGAFIAVVGVSLMFARHSLQSCLQLLDSILQ